MVPDDELIKFPCYFPFKAIGRDESNYLEFVIASVLVHVPELNAEEVTTRPSHGGKYLAVTVPFIAQSRQQLDAIYTSVSQDKRTVFLL